MHFVLSYYVYVRYFPPPPPPNVHAPTAVSIPAESSATRAGITAAIVTSVLLASLAICVVVVCCYAKRKKQRDLVKDPGAGAGGAAVADGTRRDFRREGVCVIFLFLA